MKRATLVALFLALLVAAGCKPLTGPSPDPQDDVDRQDPDPAWIDSGLYSGYA